MKCKNHPKTEASATCVTCGNFFCDACLTVVNRKNHCKDCIQDIVGKDDAGGNRSVTVSQQQQLVGGWDWHSVLAGVVNIGSWLLSLLFFLDVVGYGVTGSFVLAFLFLLLLFLWFPPLWNWLKKERNVELPLWMRIVATLLMLVVSGLLFRSMKK